MEKKKEPPGVPIGPPPELSDDDEDIDKLQLEHNPIPISVPRKTIRYYI